jgi:hypothetical protein
MIEIVRLQSPVTPFTVQRYRSHTVEPARRPERVTTVSLANGCGNAFDAGRRLPRRHP